MALLIENFCGKCLYELMYTEEEVAAKIAELDKAAKLEGYVIHIAP